MIFYQSPEAILGIAVALVVGITFHEFSHAFVADQLGDRRPRALGRISLNPARHIEPLGAIVFLLAGFGWGRPVPVNPSALRGGARAMALVSGAGPLANLLIAVAFAIPLRLLLAAGVELGIVGDVIFVVVLFNVILALFNLLPIPPLDGFRFVLTFLPPPHAYAIQRYESYGALVLLALVVISQISPETSPLRLLFDVAYSVTLFLVSPQGIFGG